MFFNILIVLYNTQWRIQYLTLGWGGAWTLSTGRGGGRTSLNVSNLKNEFIFSVFGHILLKLCLKIIASEASEKQFEKISVFGITNHMSAVVREDPLDLDPLVIQLLKYIILTIDNDFVCL